MRCWADGRGGGRGGAEAPRVEMAEQVKVIIEMLYDLAKSGQWDKVLRAFDEEPRVAAKCSRHRRRPSGSQSLLWPGD